MSTAAQRTAAVANAQHSTGPRTPEGKTASSRNALKFGIFSDAMILPGEDIYEYNALSFEIMDRFKPSNAVEIVLCHEVIHGMWLYQRFVRIEREIVQIRAAALPADCAQLALGHIYDRDLATTKILEKIDRRRRAALRQYHTALAELNHALLLRRQAAPAEARTSNPVNHIPENPVRFDKPAPTGASPVYTSGPTPVRTPSNNWDNPALRL